MQEVLWIAGTPPPGLAIVLCPQGGAGLPKAMQRFRQAGVDTVVSMLEPEEAGWLELSGEEAAASQAGLQFLSYPIGDTQVPADEAAFSEFIAGVVERLLAGERVGVHCRGSIGRATVMAAATLMHLGWTPEAALKAIERARGYPVPDTLMQYEWILSYEARP